MGALLRTIDDADKLAALYRQGLAAAVVVEDRLLARGFYAVAFDGRRISAWLNGVRFEFDGTHVPFSTERAA